LCATSAIDEAYKQVECIGSGIMHIQKSLVVVVIFATFFVQHMLTDKHSYYSKH